MSIVFASIRLLTSKTAKPHFQFNAVRTLSDQVNSSEEDLPITDLQNPFKKETVECILCKHKITPDYKNVRLLSQFQSPYTGRVYGRHITGLCKNKQFQIELEIRKAQKSGIMPYYYREPKFGKDPKLFNPDRPLRSHKY